MYSRAVIKKKLEALARKGHNLIYYTPEESQAAIKHFTDSARFDDNGQFLGWTRALTRDEEDFIANEALLCQVDFWYASSHYAKIMSWRKELELFAPNVAQKIKLDVYGALEERNLAIIMQALKARQLGSSTLDELIIWHRATFHPHTNAIVGSSDPTKSAKMFQMVERAWTHTPFYLRPQTTSYRRGEFYNFEGIDSSISIQHGTQRSGIGRGDTPNVVHLSEIVDYDKPEQLIDASLLRAAHEISTTFISLESTANGRGDWWHRTWLANRENEALGIAKMHPVFLPWFVGTDIWPSPHWLRARPVPRDWEPKESTIAHAVRAADYVSKSSLLRKHLAPDGTDWVMPIEQMWFYEVERIWASQKGELNIFLSEMPASEEEAFQSRTGSIFPIEIIADRREATMLPKAAYSIENDDVSQRLIVPASGLDPNGKMIILRPGAYTPHQTRFLPILVDERFDPLGKLCVWEPPAPYEEYEIAVDTGYGIGQDRTVIQVGRRGTPERPDAQVAEWASNQAGALDVWPIVLAIGRYYTTEGADGTPREPRITIEMAANGEALQLELRKRGWRRFYIRNRLGSALHSDRIIDPNLGWVTSFATRTRLIDHLIKVVRDGLVEIRSPWLIDECADLQRSERNLKIEAAQGAYDDRLMAFAIMSYVMYDLDPRGEPSATYRQRAERAAEAASMPQAVPSTQSLPVFAEGIYDEWERSG